MQKVATAKEMQAADQFAIEHCGIPGIVLMENAGLKVFEKLRLWFPDLSKKKVAIFAGKGNNGGDGFVIARHLFNHHIETKIHLIGKLDALKEDAKTNAEAAVKIGISLEEINKKNFSVFLHSLKHCHIIIDAIFGTGIKTPVSGFYAKVIEAINKLEKPVVSVDIPSGMDSDSGQLTGPYIRADYTVALALFKRSHLLYPAAESMGRLELVDISMPDKAVSKPGISVQLLEEEDVKNQFSSRSANSHKGSFGHTLVIAGSKGKGGAAGLTALAALRTGSGLVTIATPESCAQALEFNPMEVMTVSLKETAKGCISEAAKDQLFKAVEGKSSIALGPGITTEPETLALLEDILPEINIPIVIDADGLNGLANSDTLLKHLKPETVLTPHPKEMSRLSGLTTRKILENRIEVVKNFSGQYNVILLLKGAHTLIAFPDGTVTINPSGNPGMATGGSGDVLTGIIAGLLAQGMVAQNATLCGCYIHGLAGDDYANVNSQTSLVASDLLHALPETLKRILP